jgi:hypothetical protein
MARISVVLPILSRGHALPAEKQPAVFATCARLIDPEVKLTIEQNYAGLSPKLVLVNEVTAAINEGLPCQESLGECA